MDPKGGESSLARKEKVVSDGMIEEVNEEEEEEEEDDGREKLGGEGNGEVKPAAGRGKRGSNSGGASPPSCQAENCGADLTYAKKYHRRHKVCEFHSKAPVVMVVGLRQRFCQQCSRFHEIAEFDESKRSCRKRLAKHNERRRTRPTNAAAKLHPRLVPRYQATADRYSHEDKLSSWPSQDSH